MAEANDPNNHFREEKIYDFISSMKFVEAIEFLINNLLTAANKITSVNLQQCIDTDNGSMLPCPTQSLQTALCYW